MSCRPRRARLGPPLAGYSSILLGMTVAAMGTALSLGAESAVTTTAFWGGAIAVLGGTTLVLSGIRYVGGPAETSVQQPPSWKQAQRGDVKAPPKLGELAVQHCAFITPEQLDVALEVHRTENRPLGGVMVSMGLITPDQLAQLLAVQERRGDHWGAGR